MAIHAESQLYQENLGVPLCTNSQGWWSMENACGFSELFINTSTTIHHKQERQSFHQQQQQNHTLHHQQQMNQNVMQYGQSFLVPTPGKKIANNNDHLPVAWSQSLAAQMEAQRQELDQYLRLQSLGLMLQEQRKKQLGLLMEKLESKTINLLRQKDKVIAQAAQSQMELEGYLRKLEMESQEWQRMARENEAMVESLNNTLEEVREKACCCISNNAVEDTESCCDVNMIGDTDEQKTAEKSSRRLVLVDDDHGPQQRTSRKMMVCKGCNSRESCMLFLPCRHLCSCKTCEAFLGWCPVCRTIKNTSIEALI